MVVAYRKSFNLRSAVAHFAACAWLALGCLEDFFGGGAFFPPLCIPPLALGGKWSPARLPEKQAVGKKE